MLGYKVGLMWSALLGKNLEYISLSYIAKLIAKTSCFADWGKHHS